MPKYPETSQTLNDQSEETENHTAASSNAAEEHEFQLDIYIKLGRNLFCLDSEQNRLTDIIKRIEKIMAEYRQLDDEHSLVADLEALIELISTNRIDQTGWVQGDHKAVLRKFIEYTQAIKFKQTFEKDSSRFREPREDGIYPAIPFDFKQSDNLWELVVWRYIGNEVNAVAMIDQAMLGVQADFYLALVDAYLLNLKDKKN